jgi:hypothetical protein
MVLEVIPNISGKDGDERPCRDDGGGEIVRFCASFARSHRACNIDPPTSVCAIMRQASPYRRENHGPGLDEQTRA